MMTGPSERAYPQGVDRSSAYVRHREASERRQRRAGQIAAEWLHDALLQYKLRWLAVEREKLPKATGSGGGMMREDD